MASSKQILFQRLVEGRLIESENPAEIWPDWKGNDESWLFMSPLDDDIVCGCGLTFLSALKIGVKTSAGVVTNGKMGYCRPEQKETIAAIRRDECAASCKMLGLPEELYTPIFALARITGWSAHRIEEIVGRGKILRPAYMSVMKRIDEQ